MQERSVKISRILHAGYIFECEGTRIVFDPIFENPFSRNCYAFPEVSFDTEQIRKEHFDAIFISHYHDDHCSFESLDLLDREIPIYMYCVHEEMFALLRELGFKKVHSLELGTPVDIGTFEVTPWRALDADVDSILQIRAAGLKILNMVDSWMDDAMLGNLVRRGPWDMVLWPFQTMREIEVLSPSRFPPATGELPPEWIEQLKALNPRYVVPSSCQFRFEEWSWYNWAYFPVGYARFQKEVGGALPRAKIVRMDPSVSLELRKDSLREDAPLTWIKMLAEKDVDYDFRDVHDFPTTEKIARKFDPLSEAQKNRVDFFCKEELLERYTSLDQNEEDYFRQLRRWTLKVYDHEGNCSSFHFQVGASKIEPLADCLHPDWVTEIPSARLYGALEHGESLTSLYVRINDRDMKSNHVRDEASLMEDPLLRCLFEGKFASYQKAQLCRQKKGPGT